MFQGVSVLALVVVAFILVTVLMGVRQVPQGYNYTVERFGRYYKTLTPGLGLIVPYIDSVGRKLNVMEQVVDVPQQEIITKDNATVTVDGVAFYQVLDVRRASYEVANLEVALLNLVMTNVRTVMGSMDLDQLLSHRDDINQRLLSVIDAASEPWGVKVTRIEIKDIEPPRDLVESMARQMKAEREKRAVILEAEGMRQADITRAEGRKAAVILEAEGRREAAFREAEARERAAQAEATATRLVSEATAQGDAAAINYLVADKYVRALQALAQAPNQKVFIVPLELASLAGTLGGISQIAASALGETAASETALGARRPTRAVPDANAQHPAAAPPSSAAGPRPGAAKARGEADSHAGLRSSELVSLAGGRLGAVRRRNTGAGRVPYLDRRGGGDCRRSRLFRADGPHSPARAVRRARRPIGPDRPARLRLD
jgi:regulator of protease activity HflC (stomatin/prohibitin superfamily)